MERCVVCGFAWDEVDPEEISPRLRAAGAAMAVALLRQPEAAGTRDRADRWSAVDYVAHVRDVLLNLRDRVILGAIEDNPVPKPMHADARVALGLYADEEPDRLADEVESAAGLLARTWTAIPLTHRLRPIFYGYPIEATRTLTWVAAQALHEIEHHLDDVRALLAAATDDDELI